MKNKPVHKMTGAEIDTFVSKNFLGLTTSNSLGRVNSKTGAKYATVHRKNIKIPKNQRPKDHGHIRTIAKNYSHALSSVALFVEKKVYNKKTKKHEFTLDIQDGQHHAVASPSDYIFGKIVSSEEHEGYKLFCLANDTSRRKPVTSEDKFYSYYDGEDQVAKILYRRLTKNYGLKIARSWETKSKKGLYTNIGEIWKHFESKSFTYTKDGIEASDELKINKLKNIVDIGFCWFHSKDFLGGEKRGLVWNEIKKAQDAISVRLKLEDRYLSADKFIDYVVEYAQENNYPQHIITSCQSLISYLTEKAEVKAKERGNLDHKFLNKDSFVKFFSCLKDYIIAREKAKSAKIIRIDKRLNKIVIGIKSPIKTKKRYA
jgi:hypothetical protein